MSLNYKNRKIAILGAGVTGIAVAKTLTQLGATIVIVDEKSDVTTDFTLVRPDGVKITDFSGVVISPGWRGDHPLIRDAIAAGVELLNEIDIAWNIAQEIAPHLKWLATIWKQ